MPTTQNALLVIGYGNFTNSTGKPVDHIVVSATGTVPANSPPSQNVPPGTTSVTFSNLAPDTYALSAQAVDATGAPIGLAATGSQVITSVTQPLVVQIPNSLASSQP